MVFWYILLGFLALSGTLLLCSLIICGAYYFYRVIRYWSKLSDQEFHNNFAQPEVTSRW